MRSLNSRSRSILWAILALASCSNRVDHAKLIQAAANARDKALAAVADCSLKYPCDRSEYDSAFRELEDAVIDDPALKKAVAEYGVATELALSSPRREAASGKFQEAGLRLDNAVKETR